MPILGNVLPPSNELTPTTVTATGLVTAGAKLDMNGTEIILDADADTSITADTDDQIDIRIAGADDFQFTPNTFTALSGSTVNIASGATITNSGTATGFGVNLDLDATSGVIETDGTYVAVCKFGPALDGVNWDERTAASTAKFMLATIKDAGADTTVEIWSGTVTPIAGSTALASVTLTGAATPTSIAAAMGYIIVGSEDGISIIDPHSGAWAERTVGWPRSLSTSTVPALHNQAVGGVAAGFSDAPAYDSRTGGHLPSFGVKYTAGTKQGSLIKDDGNVWDITGGGASAETGCLIHNGRLYFNYSNTQLRATNPLSVVTADQSVNPPYLFVYTNNYPYNIAAAVDKMSAANRTIALASGEGLGFNLETSSTGRINAVGSGNGGINASVTRAFNTGYYTEYTKGIWLANSKTVDRGPLANTLTENGTVTEAAVETGAELKGYSGFSAANNLTRASDADWDVITTGSAYLSIWVKGTTFGTEHLLGFANSGNTIRFLLVTSGTGNINAVDDGATASVVVSTTSADIDDGVWRKLDWVRVSSTERYLYIDGVQVGSSTANAGSLTGSGALPFGVGIDPNGSSNPATSCSLALARLSATAPSATQIRQMYEAEKGMFVASSKCLLQSGSTDAVLDVDIDAITGFVTVVQTDDEAVWDGLAIHSEPTIPTGGTTWEHSVRHAGAAFTITDANFAGNVPAIAVRDVASDVQGLMGKLPAGVDLSKAKAWIKFEGDGGPQIWSSYNIEKIVVNGTGDFQVHFGVPFKTNEYVSTICHETYVGTAKTINASNKFARALCYNTSNALADCDDVQMLFFGELENE